MVDYKRNYVVGGCYFFTVTLRNRKAKAERRSFQATMTLKYCRSNARLAERVFGWGRDTVQLGLNEQRTGVICWGMQSAYGGGQVVGRKAS